MVDVFIVVIEVELCVLFIYSKRGGVNVIVHCHKNCRTFALWLFVFVSEV